MSGAVDEPPPIRALLEREGLWADKGLGQHFLLDLNITRRIARAAGDIAGKPVIEIGPGPGGLTRALLEAGADPLYVIERDARFLPILEELRPWTNDRLRVVHADALDIDEASLAPKAAIVANLPYNVATPLLVKWLKAGPGLDPLVLMFQAEVADRIVATRGSSAYGRLSVLAQALRKVERAMKLPARAFTPPPKVDSAVVRLDHRADAFPDIEALERVSAAAFGQRRKMLRSALRSLTPTPETLLAAAGLTPTARAEEIDIAGFRALAEAWRKAQSSSA
ncbi:MAG: 16S rRNA (adenine(1518)-N(6)/adenine(1519)-N(6))-dimethyltransferase RsmA [Hyphomonadaceae bacterium]|nr:16S rRNA (adenine(1518)-N(6)/adenine(1519)-N(6))-dimethyltransferase RsmA [Hyphomonadaceae bacterium]